MIRLRTLLLAASIGFPEAPAAQPAGQSERRGPGPGSALSLLEVPYLSQSEALCGGAAAAMVLRYWGARGVSPEEFAPLVDRSRSGIATSALARAIRERGYEALAALGTAALVQTELAAGRPVVALIEDRPGTFHYVVIVGWHDRAVVLHDPARTPYMLMAPAAFERRWKPGGNWMLAVAPGSESPFRVPVQIPGSDPPFRVGVRSPGSEPGPAGARALSTGCDALVTEGVRLAQQSDLTAAEPLLTAAAYECGGAPALRELAGLRLLQRRWTEVRELAGQALALDPSDAHAWQLLAAASYIDGDPARALDAWNEVGEPLVDLVTVAGLHRTHHRAVERYLAIEPGAVLTRRDADRARRRLGELPAATMTRLEYVPRPSGRAEVRAHVVERSLFPRGRLTWAAIALGAASTREIAMPLSSPGRGGERLDAVWRFWPRRPAFGLALRVPASAGLVSMELAAERQPFDVPGLPEAERVQTRLRLADWASGSLRWEARAGFARWTGNGSFGTIGAAVKGEAGRIRAGAQLDTWLGADPFLTGQLQAGWRSSPARRGLVADLSAMLDTASSDAPLDLWPAGDTGHARRSLLRAHPVLDGGRLRADRLGRYLAQITAEAQHWWRVRIVPVGAAVFVDGARTAGRATPNTALTDVDVGAGFRLALPGRDGSFRADLARGLRDGRTVFSVSWIPD